ncbi:MAG: hypothetical protein IPL65_08685 [Lewinellaceae bacterium]|nr:hypothetical protein [Lewinellaceae bacterium]
MIAYFYHLYLIHAIDNSESVSGVQENLSRLKLSSFNITRLAMLQIPFWSLCWVSMDALQSSPLLYGGVNLLVFLGLAYLAYWLYNNLDVDKMDKKWNQFMFSGVEWDPIVKSVSILQQLEESKA